MKIRLGIIDNDGMYKTRLINYFNANYADKLEIFSFSTLENLKQYMQESNLDVLLADEESVPDTEELPSGVAFAYWSDSANIDSIRNKRTVCKYQKAELIYKEILGLYAEIDNNVTSYKLDGSNGVVLTFMGAAGGVGSSTVAVGCAMYLARQGKKVLYLDMTRLGDTSLYFSGEGNATLSDVFYSIKSNNANLFLKLESMVKRDGSGVNYYESCRVALDFRDTKAEDITHLIKSILDAQSYEYIIVDAEPSLDEKMKAILAVSSAVIVIGDGTSNANLKLAKLIEALQLDGGKKDGLERKMFLLYNRFHTGAQKAVLQEKITELGGINAYKNGSPRQIAEEIAGKSVFARFLITEE